MSYALISLLLLIQRSSVFLETLILAVYFSLVSPFLLLVCENLQGAERSGSDILTNTNSESLLKPLSPPDTRQERRNVSYRQDSGKTDANGGRNEHSSVSVSGFRASWLRECSDLRGTDPSDRRPSRGVLPLACLPACLQRVWTCRSLAGIAVHSLNTNHLISAALRSPAPSNHRSGLRGSKLSSLGPMLSNRK